MSASPTPNTVAALRNSGPPPVIAELLPRLLNGDTPKSITVLKPGAVFQVHTPSGEPDLVLKLFKRSTKAGARLKAPAAKRVVDAYFRLLPVASPKPVFWDKLDDPNFASVLVYEFADGETLHQLWKKRDASALAALPAILAAIYQTGVLHGDLHARNLVWAEGTWFVIDLDGVRSGIHGLRRKAIWERTWARLLFDFEGSPDARALFDSFVTLAALGWDAKASWQHICDLYKDICTTRAAKGIHPGD